MPIAAKALVAAVACQDDRNRLPGQPGDGEDVDQGGIAHRLSQGADEQGQVIATIATDAQDLMLRAVLPGRCRGEWALIEARLIAGHGEGPNMGGRLSG